MKFDDETCAVFSLLPSFDLNLVPNAGIGRLVEFQEDVGYCCCKNGMVYAKVGLLLSFLN